MDTISLHLRDASQRIQVPRSIPGLVTRWGDEEQGRGGWTEDGREGDGMGGSCLAANAGAQEHTRARHKVGAIEEPGGVPGLEIERDG